MLVIYAVEMDLYWFWHLVDGFQVVFDVIRVVFYQSRGRIDVSGRFEVFLSVSSAR
jgi:hypothetical protein